MLMQVVYMVTTEQERITLRLARLCCSSQALEDGMSLFRARQATCYSLPEENYYIFLFLVGIFLRNQEFATAAVGSVPLSCVCLPVNKKRNLQLY
jgi:hypothetical protein